MEIIGQKDSRQKVANACRSCFASAPFTVPSFNATDPQRDNMQVLLSMLLGSSQKADLLEIAELYRELENYDEAQKAIEKFEADEHIASKLLRELIQEKASEPMRYRM